MKSIDMKNYAEGQVAFWTKQITFDKGQIEWTNKELARTRKEDREQKEWAKTYNNGEFAHVYEGRYQGKETKKLLNERRRWQRDLKNAEKELARYQQMVADNTEDEEVKEEETMNTTIDTSKGGTINAFIDALIAKGYKVTKADAPNANFQCYEAKITDKSGYNTITIFFGGETPKITARVDKVNGTHKWYYGKTIAQMLAVVRQCMEGYDWTKPTKAEAIEAMDDDAEDPSVTLDEFIAKAQEIDNMKEETTMESTEIKLTTPRTFEREGGRSAVTITKLWRRYPTDSWTLYDDDYATWYRKPQWDEDGKLAFYMPDSVKGQRILMTEQELNDMISNTKEEETMETKTEVTIIDTIPTTTNNEEEDTTMKTTETTTFELGEATYTMNPKTNRYSKTENGKTKRIGKAEYDEAKAKYDIAWATYEQEKLDAEPSRVEVNSDLHEAAVLDEFGCVDCRKCNVNGCVHRNCMRRNPKSVGGLGECPRLDNGVASEAQKVAEETGMELAEAELAVNVRNEQKKARKARKSKDIAYEGNGVTLTAKQVDFLGHLSDTCFWENGAESTAWVDVLCDEIGGQFADKPMTVGAMVSTLCEKGLGYRGVEKMTDMATGRSHKATYFGLTDLGQKIYTELGLE